MKKRTVFRVLPVTERGTLKGWKVTKGGKDFSYFLREKGHTKATAVLYARKFAREWVFSQLFIHGRDGRIMEERTFPRSSDPRRSKG